MRMLVLAALALPTLSLANECKIVSYYQGGGTTAISSQTVEAESAEGCLKAATGEIGKTKKVTVHRGRGMSRRVTVRVESVDIKTTIDGIRFKGSVTETSKETSCKVKELVKFMGNEWESTDITDLSSCIDVAKSRLVPNLVKFKVSQDGFLFSGKLKSLIAK